MPDFSPSRMVELRVLRALPYAEGVRLQRERLAAMAADPGHPGLVLFAEHNPVITLGRSGDGSSLLVGPDVLAADGIEFHPVSRGGDVTYHGPGQWTVYPVVRLAWFDKNLHRYLRLLEECVIHFLAGYGIAAGRRAGLTGAWVGRAKLAAVGVAVNRWIAWHGTAVNINPDLGRFTRYMIPCGIASETGSVTDLSQELGRVCTMEETLFPLARSILDTLQLEASNMDAVTAVQYRACANPGTYIN